MQTADIDNTIDSILKSLSMSARSRFKSRYTEAKAELKKFEATMKKNLRRYTLALAEEELTKEQYKQLVADDIRLAEMKSITQAGITLVEIQKYKEAALKKILKVVFEEVLPEPKD